MLEIIYILIKYPINTTRAVCDPTADPADVISTTRLDAPLVDNNAVFCVADPTVFSADDPNNNPLKKASLSPVTPKSIVAGVGVVLTFIFIISILLTNINTPAGKVIVVVPIDAKLISPVAIVAIDEVNALPVNIPTELVSGNMGIAFTTKVS